MDAHAYLNRGRGLDQVTLDVIRDVPTGRPGPPQAQVMDDEGGWHDIPAGGDLPLHTATINGPVLRYLERAIKNPGEDPGISPDMDKALREVFLPAWRQPSEYVKGESPIVGYPNRPRPLWRRTLNRITNRKAT